MDKDGLDDIDIYLQIPEDKITNRTRDLTREIVAGSQSDYHKAIAIEDYLRKNFVYSLSPNEIPKGDEFIDYFLFEGQEGYCTYYATTMAIMLRLEGIPSRYVEGYLALEPMDEGIYEVRHDNAHAWVEAFIEPVGWMQFEPTPAFPVQVRLEDYISEVAEDTSVPDIIHDTNPGLDDFYERPEVTDDSELGFSGGIIDNEDFPEENSNNPVITTIMALLIILLPIRFLVGLYRHSTKESKAKKLPNNKRIIYLYSEITKLISLLGYPQRNGETHHEYAQRVGYKFYELGEDNIKGFRDITDIFVRSKYGDMTSQEDILILDQFKRVLEIRLKNKLGRIQYFYNKYVRQKF